MLASPRNSGRQGVPVANPSGFTLVELLTVIAIIMILAGIVVGVQRGVYSSQANAKARGEIQTIATALERYKAAYGTYPRIEATTATAAQELYDHLTGVKHARYRNDAWSTNTIDESKRRPFIDASTMTPNNRTTPTHFVDPWGSPYVYVYATDDEGDNGDFGDHFFILYSKGPSKTEAAITAVNRFSSATNYFTTEDSRDDIVYGLEYNP